MRYHIDTGLIIEKFKESSECPLCVIKKIVEEQFLHEFLNDAVMEDSTRKKVNEKGFCATHFDQLFNRQNKLSVALQIETRTNTLAKILKPVKSKGEAKKCAKSLKQALSTCIICDLTKESMKKYYITVAELFLHEREFCKILLNTKGFCLEHYAELLEFASYAGPLTKQYLEALSTLQMKNFDRLKGDIDRFCAKHDYRNANMPLGSAENALPNMRTKLYGEKHD